MRFFGFQWHITDRCNLRCVHCYQDIFSNERELGIEYLKSFADKIFGSNIATKIAVNITGGEPLFYPHISELLGHLNSYKNCSEINIITNGTYITDELISKIKSLQKIKYIKISIESATSSINDRIRGINNLKLVTDNLERFKKTKKEILIMMTLASYNYREIENMVDYIERHSLSGIIFERFVPIGSGREIKGEFLKCYEWESAVENILRISNLNLRPEEVIQYKAFWLLRGRKGYKLRGALCNLGKGSMALMPDGSVYPCRRYNKKIADLKFMTFEEIISILSQYDIKNLKKNLKGDTCAICGFEDCSGCRALVYALTGNEYGDDLQCFL